MAHRLAVRPRAAVVELVVLLALLALGASPGLSDSLASLRGVAPEAVELADQESERDRARGYYEGLLDATGPRGGSSRSGDREESGPVAPPGWVRFEDAGLVEPDPGFLVWRLRPGLDVRWNGTTFRTNARGYRGPDAGEAKPPGTFRVVVLGSSNSLAQGADDRDGYVRLLERWLADRIGPGRLVEVINLAVSGYGPTQRLHRLVTEVAALEPDWILSDASALDLYLEELHLRAVVQHGHPVPYAFVREALERAGVSPADSVDDFGHKLRAVHPFLLEATYAAMAEEAGRLGVPMTVVILPRADARKDNRRMLGKIREASRAHGLACLDLSDAFDDGDLDDYRHGPWDGHPDARGHRRIFRRLLEEIDRAGGLRALVGTRPAGPKRG